MGNPFDPFNLILFLIAVVGFIRLRMILGRRTGNEDPLRQNKYASRVSADIESLTKPKEKKSLKTKEDILLFPSSEIPGFSSESFVDGASNAYEMILKNYADGNLKTIKNIISKDVYDGFNEAIKERKNKNKRLVNELIAFDKSDIIDAKIERKNVLLTVEFYSRIITYVLDENDQIIEGSKDNPISVIDQWTFKKALKDKSPSWQLISTQSES